MLPSLQLLLWEGAWNPSGLGGREAHGSPNPAAVSPTSLEPTVLRGHSAWLLPFHLSLEPPGSNFPQTLLTLPYHGVAMFPQSSFRTTFRGGTEWGCAWPAVLGLIRDRMINIALVSLSHSQLRSKRCPVNKGFWLSCKRHPSLELLRCFHFLSLSYAVA